MDYLNFYDRYCFLAEQIDAMEEKLRTEEVAQVIQKQLRQQLREFKRQKQKILKDFAKAFPQSFAEASKMPEADFSFLLQMLRKNSGLCIGIEAKLIALFQDICAYAGNEHPLLKYIPDMAVILANKKMSRYLYGAVAENPYLLKFAEWLYGYEFASLPVKVELNKMKVNIQGLHGADEHPSDLQRKLLLALG